MEDNDTNTSHPLSEKTTNTDDAKLSTTAAALTDPDFPLPTIRPTTSNSRTFLSFAVLLTLLAGGIAGAWYFEASIFQAGSSVWAQGLFLGGVVAALLIALFATGTVWIDWWELVLGYWWLSIPVGAAAGLAFVLNQESGATMGEVQ